MRYRLIIGNMSGVYKEMGVEKNDIDSFVESNSDIDKGLGIHSLFKCNLEKVNQDINDNERYKIISEYNNICDNIFYYPDFEEPSWVGDDSLSNPRFSCYRQINSEFIDSFKEKVKYGRDLFRSIKDLYEDKKTHPFQEISFINTKFYKETLINLSREILENHDDMDLKHLEFIKWLYFWSVKSLKKSNNLAIVRFEAI